MEHIQWIFSGIGTTIISFVLGLVTGAFTGIKIYKSIKQKQISKDDSEQKQIGAVFENKNNKNKIKIESAIKQTQKAGNNSNQIQIGEVIK